MAEVITGTPLDTVLDPADAFEPGERRRASQGGRGRGRGRGSGRGRGPRSRRGVRGGPHSVARYGRILEDPSKGWHIRTPAAHSVSLDREFSRDVFAERARLFCSSAMSQLRIENRTWVTGYEGRACYSTDGHPAEVPELDEWAHSSARFGHTTRRPQRPLSLRCSSASVAPDWVEL